MRADRLITLLMLLQERGRTPARDLAHALETSERTILRDVESLAFAGVPVRAVRGRHGGIELREGFRSELTALNADEAEGLPLSALPELAAALGIGGAADRAGRKLAQALDPEHRERAAAMADRVHVPAPGDPAGRLPRILTAIQEQRVIRIGLRAGQTVSINPLGVVVASDAWHLVGTEPGQAVPLGDIARMTVTATRFMAPDEVDLAGRWAVAST